MATYFRPSDHHLAILKKLNDYTACTLRWVSVKWPDYGQKNLIKIRTTKYSYIVVFDEHYKQFVYLLYINYQLDALIIIYS